MRCKFPPKYFVLAVLTVSGLVWMYAAMSRSQGRQAQLNAGPLAAEILKSQDANTGLCVLVGLRDGNLAVALSNNGKLLVHGISRSKEVVEQARQDIARAGLSGVVSVETGFYGRLPYADNLVNLLVVDDAAKLFDKGLQISLNLQMSEVLRVLRPGGIAWIGQAKGTKGVLTEKRLAESMQAAGIKQYKISKSNGLWAIFKKPRPGSMDQWTHKRYNASGNAVSADKEAGVPTGVRWVAGPQWPTGSRYTSVHAAVVSTEQIVYVFEDEIVKAGKTQKQNSLVARDAYNGLFLWKRKAVSGKYPLVSIGDRIWTVVKDNGPLVALNAKTGKVMYTFEKIKQPTDLVHSGGLLIATHSGGMSCLDAASGKTLWQKQFRPNKILSGEGRVFVHVDNARRGGKSAFLCLNIKTGKEFWNQPTSWSKATPSLVFYQNGILVAAGKEGNHGVSAKDGKHLWSYKYKLIGHGGRYDKILCMDNLVWVHSAGSKKNKGYAWEGLDPKTGKLSKRLAQPSKFRLHHRCMYDVATQRYFLCGSMDFADLVTGEYHHFTAARNSCRGGGMLPANGLVYSFPHACGCYAMMRGFMGLSSQPLPKAVGKFETSYAFRLQSGTAYGKAVERFSVEKEWPTYRHDQERSASTAEPGPQTLTQIWSQSVIQNGKNTALREEWEVKTGGRLSSPVVAGRRAFVAAADEHRLSAYDAKSGKPKWSYVAGGRIDCPPTISEGLCLFGCRDGWVYCLRALDGALVWRFRASPAERRVMAFGQLESAWPVTGGVLVYNGLAYFACGRHSGSDGGVFVYAAQPQSGKLVWANRAETLKGVPDVLTGGDGNVQMAGVQFDAKTGKRSETKTPRLHGGRLGLLADGWYKRPIAIRRNLQPWKAGKRPGGQMLAFNKDTTCGYVACSKVNTRDGRMSGNASLFAKPVKSGGNSWTIKMPLSIRVRGMALTPERLYVAGPIHETAKNADTTRNVVRVYSLAKGKVLAEQVVEGPLIHDCLAIAGRRLYLTTQTGKLICLGEK